MVTLALQYNFSKELGDSIVAQDYTMKNNVDVIGKTVKKN